MTDRLGTLCLISAIALVACGADAEEPTPTSTAVAVSSTDSFDFLIEVGIESPIHGSVYGNRITPFVERHAAHRRSGDRQ